MARFTKVATFICQFFEKTKSESIVKEVYDQFEDGTCHRLGLCSNKSFVSSFISLVGFQSIYEPWLLYPNCCLLICRHAQQIQRS